MSGLVILFSKDFFNSVLSKFGFGPEIIRLINMLTYDTSSCVIQNGHIFDKSKNPNLKFLPKEFKEVYWKSI